MSFRISTGRLSSASVSRSSALNAKRRFAERQALEVERAHDAVLGAAGGRAQHLHRQRAGRVVGGGQRVRGRQAAVDHGDRARPDLARERRHEFGAAADIDAVGEPDHLDIGVAPRKRPSAGSASARSTACGFGLICLSRTRAAAGVSNEMSRLGSDSGMSATPRLSASARAISRRRCACARPRCRRPKPSSISSAIGAARSRSPPADSTAARRRRGSPARRASAAAA